MAKRPPSGTQVKRGKVGSFLAGGEQNCIGCIQPAADKFQVHGGFVLRPDSQFLWIDAENTGLARPVHQRLEAVIGFRRPVKERGKGNIPLASPARVESRFSSVTEKNDCPTLTQADFEHVDEIAVVFPVPGKAQVVMDHGAGIIKRKKGNG